MTWRFPQNGQEMKNHHDFFEERFQIAASRDVKGPNFRANFGEYFGSVNQCFRGSLHGVASFEVEKAHLAA